MICCSCYDQQRAKREERARIIEEKKVTGEYQREKVEELDNSIDADIRYLARVTERIAKAKADKERFAAEIAVIGR